MPDTQRPTVNELRALGAALPPSERLQTAETADVLSAVVAIVTHGPDVLAASKEGGDAVYALYHQSVTDNRPDGADEPQRGYVHEPVAPAAPNVAVGSQQLDYDQLAAAIVRAQSKQDAENKPAPDVREETSGKPVTEPSHDESAHEGAPPPATTTHSDSGDLFS